MKKILAKYLVQNRTIIQIKSKNRAKNGFNIFQVKSRIDDFWVESYAKTAKITGLKQKSQVWGNQKLQ